MKIAMWSGPRNLSTAMMYSFGNRADFDVVDEPFYAAYLEATGVDHPMGDEIMQTHETDPYKVNIDLSAHRSKHLYMKHMAHHMLPGFPMDWTKDCVHVHLIRHPARVIASYVAKREAPTLEDIGFQQQARLYKDLGGLVIDSTDIRTNPERALGVLCRKLGMAFDPAMLAWQPGPRAEDGIWAEHWYGAVHSSSGFAGPEGALPALEGEMADLCGQALSLYKAMWKNRLEF